MSFWLGLGIGCNFMIDNQLQPTDRLSMIISSSHFCSNWVLEVYLLEQGLSQDLETGCLKLAIVKFGGVQNFKGAHNISTINMYKFFKKKV